MSKKVKNLIPRDSEKYEYAYMLFMQGISQKDICSRVKVTAPTLGKWKTAGGWDQKRAARTISIDELMQKTLQKINAMLDKGEDFSADAFAKAVAQLKTLKSSNTIDDDINTFLSFQDYLIHERVNNSEINDIIIKTITRLQDCYIQYRLGNGKLSH